MRTGGAADAIAAKMRVSSRSAAELVGRSRRACKNRRRCAPRRSIRARRADTRGGFLRAPTTEIGVSYFRRDAGLFRHACLRSPRRCHLLLEARRRKQARAGACVSKPELAARGNETSQTTLAARATALRTRYGTISKWHTYVRGTDQGEQPLRCPATRHSILPNSAMADAANAASPPMKISFNDLTYTINHDKKAPKVPPASSVFGCRLICVA